MNVLHLSDWHLDPRYDIGSEANCTDYLCCRPYSVNDDLQTIRANASVPASRFGYLHCDTPADLALSVFSNMDQFIDRSRINFTVFTGDIISHDNTDQLSRAYVEYEEIVTYETFKAQMGDSPIYPTLGNHDSLPEAYTTPNSINSSGSSNIFAWNYELLSSMWMDNGWISDETAQFAATHYGAYATVTSFGLKIISLNTDFWYTANPFTYNNMTNPDNSGMLSFLATELQKSEDINQRVWIIGHVPPGYLVDSSHINPSSLFYSMVVRFSPATIAGIFFGHFHQDQVMLFYDFLPNSTIVNDSSSILRDTRLVDYSKPLAVAYVGPSITPLPGLNAGWTLYQIDAATFSVINSQKYFANVSEANSWTAPEWQFEYDAREVYDPTDSWPENSPLDAEFWHGVTERMLNDIDLVEKYTLLETKSSVTTKNCSTEACARQKVCYIRSGSAVLVRACGGE